MRNAIDLIAVALFATLGCAEKTQTPAVAAAVVAAAPSAALSPAQLRAKAEVGRKVFITWCSGCHGARGQGDGPAAKAITVRPRNFTAEPFKIRSTASGQPPTRQDLFDTITRGLPGSAMPSFKFLSEEERWQLVDHVRSLAGIEGKPDPALVPLGEEPPANAESIARGKEVYAKLQCFQCHGVAGRGDGPASKTLKDDSGRSIPARDYSTGQYLGGDTAKAIHMRFRTGMDGTPMPSFADSVSVAQGWDLAHYVLSLQLPKAPPPSDPVAYGRRIVEERLCYACHTIEGRGGDVGPSLDVAAHKLRYDWVKEFLTNPLPYGKLYHYMPYRMPHFDLKPDEIDAVISLFAKIGDRKYPEPPPVAETIDPKKATEGQLIYFVKCTECHNMGTVVPTPEAKQQGPDLINVSKRIRFEWIPTWVNNPKQLYPGARMVDTNLSPDEIEAVRSFVWKTSVDALAKQH